MLLLKLVSDMSRCATRIYCKTWHLMLVCITSNRSSPMSLGVLQCMRNHLLTKLHSSSRCHLSMRLPTSIFGGTLKSSAMTITTVHDADYASSLHETHGKDDLLIACFCKTSPPLRSYRSPKYCSNACYFCWRYGQARSSYQGSLYPCILGSHSSRHCYDYKQFGHVLQSCLQKY